MSYPRFNELTNADKARDWKPGITPQEYQLAKGARTEMLNSFGSAQPYKGTSSVSKASKRKAFASKPLAPTKADKKAA